MDTISQTSKLYNYEDQLLLFTGHNFINQQAV